MTQKAIPSNTDGCLILILPLALGIIFLFATWPLLLAVFVLTIAWKAWQRYQWQQWSQQVNPIFNQLIQHNQGTITAMDLAIKGNFSAAIAKQYLDTKAQEFGAQRQELVDQGTAYYFITASTLGSIFDQSEPERQDLAPSSYLKPGESTKAENQTSELATEQPETTQVETEPLISSEHQNQLQQPEKATHSSQTSEEVEALDRQHLASICLIQSELAKRLNVYSSTVYKRRDDPDFAEWTRNRDPEGIAWKYSPDTKLFSPVETKHSD